MNKVLTNDVEVHFKSETEDAKIWFESETKDAEVQFDPIISKYIYFS